MIYIVKSAFNVIKYHVKCLDEIVLFVKMYIVYLVYEKILKNVIFVIKMDVSIV